MSSSDADEKSSTVDRVAFLDQLLCRRMEELEAAEVRLQKRFEQVAHSEQRLANLQSALNQSIAAAGTTINQLADFRDKAGVISRDVIGTAKSDLAKLAETAQKTSANARELMETLPKSVAARIEVLKGEVERTLAAAGKKVDSQCEQFERRAMVFEEWLTNQIAAAREALEAEASKSITTVAREWQQRAMARLVDQERRIAAMISSLESRVGELVGAFEKDLFGKAAAMQSQLDGSLESAEVRGSELTAKMKHRLNSFEQGAENVARMMDHVLRSGMDEMHERAMGVSTPMLKQLEAELIEDLKVRADSIGQALSGKLAEIKTSLEGHVAELCGAGEALFEHAEERIAQRVRDVRPEAAAALEAAGDMLSQRLSQMLSSARGMVELTESQLQRRIDGLSTRAGAAMRSMEAELAEKMAHVEQEAHAAATHLEESLVNHAQSMIERERRIVQQQSGQGGQVEVFFKGPRAAETDSAAA